MQQPPPPFSCVNSPNLPELLYQLQCTLIISTYQAGKVIFISAKDTENIVQLPRNFNKAMGIALHEDKMGIATQDEVIVLANAPGLAPKYPRKPNTYDAFFVPRATYYTGQVDLHDLHFGNQGLWGVNTSFSCVTLIDSNYSFTPKWQPHFIDQMVSEDRCHLNGLAMQDGEPLYVSALGNGNTHQSWRDNIVKGGILMHMPDNEIVLQGLAMPHSPRIYDGKLYMLLSASGELICADLQKGTYDVVTQLKGFVRGMARHGDYLFIGLSKLRQNSSTFKHLDIAKIANVAGVVVIHLPTGAQVASLMYQSSVDEIYDIQILPDAIRPGILNPYTDYHKRSLSIPSGTYWAVDKQTDQSV